MTPNTLMNTAEKYLDLRYDAHFFALPISVNEKEVIEVLKQEPYPNEFELETFRGTLYLYIEILDEHPINLSPLRTYLKVLFNAEYHKDMIVHPFCIDETGADRDAIMEWRDQQLPRKVDVSHEIL